MESMRKKREPTGEWRNGFLFLANQLALDLLNTRPLQDGELVELLPDFDALLRWFQAAGLLRRGEAARLRRHWKGSARARRLVQAVHDLREGLRTEILAWERGGRLRPSNTGKLNRVLSQHPMRIRLTGTGDALATELFFENREPEDLLAPLAHSAAKLFAAADRTRVRKCERCVLHFHDISKKGTRRWCSMRLCGNRSKVAAYAQRKRHSQRDQKPPEADA
jgi:predicted RNA-binding Zn ribbon-like protein